MPTPLTLSKVNVQTIASGFSYNDFILMALIADKPAASAEQLVNSADFKTNWMVEDEQLLTRLVALSRGTDPMISLTVPSVTLNWVGTPTLSMTEAQVKEQIMAGTLDDNTFITYTAVLLNKGPGATQVVNPSDYSASRDLGGWGLSQDVLLRELVTISNRNDSNNFTIDIPSMTVLWLKTVHS